MKVPRKVFGVGPILLPIQPVAASDPELEEWLKAHPTILINLGTHAVTDSESAIEMALSIATILMENPNLQILWKLKYDYTSNTKFNQILSLAIGSNRLRITSWLVTESTSILSSPTILASVHHGGANSYFEACHAGVPQILLPTWFDTYVNAAKVEYLGIGVFANKKSAPGVGRKAFTDALRKVLKDGKMRAKAKELGILCRKTVGRELACDKIVEVARAGRGEKC